jgi:hypothetical protein
LDNVSRVFKLKYLKQLIEVRCLFYLRMTLHIWLTVNYCTGRRQHQPQIRHCSR